MTRTKNSNTKHQPAPREEIQTPTETESATSTECHECGGKLIEDNSTKELHCEDCGMIAESDTIDHGPEWRSFKPSDNKSRVGAPLTEARHDKGLSTEIGWQNKDGTGKPLSGKQKSKMYRLRKWDRRSKAKDHKDRNLRKGITEILRMASALGLPDNVNETASVIFRRASEEDLIIGYSLESIASAALYITTRTENIPRTIEEVESVSRISKKRIRRAQTRLRRELEIKIEPSNPTDYIPRYSSNLEVENSLEKEARRLAENFAKSQHNSGHDPSNVAAAALYTAGLQYTQEITQADVANQCDVSAVTIRKTMQLLVDADPETNLALDEIQDLRANAIGTVLSSRD